MYWFRNAAFQKLFSLLDFFAGEVTWAGIASLAWEFSCKYELHDLSRGSSCLSTTHCVSSSYLHDTHSISIFHFCRACHVDFECSHGDHGHGLQCVGSNFDQASILSSHCLCVWFMVRILGVNELVGIMGHWIIWCLWQLAVPLPPPKVQFPCPK